MTNFEYYKEEILKIINGNSAFGVCKNSNKPIACENHLCDMCIAEGEGFCDQVIYPWLYAEYTKKEKPKLTKKERQFCEFAETGYITRSRIGILVYRLEDNKPSKDYTRGIWYSDNRNMINIHEMFPSVNFSFITWEDKEPWSIEDLLKLEAEE